MIRLLVDSASDILQGNAENIYVVPLSINILDHDYLDGVEINSDDFYKKLTSGKVYSKTAAPSPDAFMKIFEEVKANGDELICLMLSSSVSGTYQSACIAADEVGYDKIHVVDTLTGSYAVKLLAIEAMRMIEQGATCEQIVEKMHDLKKRTRVYLSVDTLDYLHRGGRLDKKSAIIGNLAKVKPIIYVSPEGYVEMYSKTIGLKKSMKAMINLALEYEVDTNYPFYSIYTYGTENPEKFEAIAKEAGIEVTHRGQFGPVVGTHCGPEAYGCIYISKK